ncbi:4a-hydroxytetrahydrobiopterin dehydratase [Litoreibacter roseus]|uniref:Putative pterin-4-alpha-carbinolamine dehydratase n=1 Tax=Litoreibacter roseus TaxID=2601869 RepID=A0A6N6JH92_9RHOB|nr:4a-hydroxytetrahydrobiopterin dehydratase [Litoreibacter roseus]GFE64759.1 putative pterin-4-alpha-carbinolamine dehydratase [Litoreibacter roseus]
MATKLDGHDRDEGLTKLKASGWTHDADRDAVSKSFSFKNFVDAFGFMTRAAIHAEKMNHHPEWSNVYKTVDVTLTTHDVDGLSELDLELAKKFDELA